MDYNCEESNDNSDDDEGHLNNGPPPLTELVVTLWYRAPELVANSHYNSIDLWSVGCILQRCFSADHCFQGRDHLHQLQLITEVMGTPTESDIRTIRGAYARRVLRSLYKSPEGMALGLSQRQWCSD